MLSITEIMENAPKGFEDSEAEAQAFLDNISIFDDVQDFWAQYEEAFSGVWNSERDFAEQLADDLGMVTSDDVARYFDYAQFEYDLFLGDYWSAKLPDFSVVVFRSY